MHGSIIRDQQLPFKGSARYFVCLYTAPVQGILEWYGHCWHAKGNA